MTRQPYRGVVLATPVTEAFGETANLAPPGLPAVFRVQLQEQKGIHVMTSLRTVSVVTGGSVGIGSDICGRLLREGQHVINLSNQQPSVIHPRLETINIDLTDRSATTALSRRLAENNLVTRFVHCAGTVRPALIENVKLEDFDYLTQLHLGAAITLTQNFLPAMRGGRFGRIVLISTRAVLGLPTRTSYSATKAAMVALVRTWSLELAASGITVNAIAPGPVDTELFRQFVPDPNRRAEVANGVPVKRLGTPADIGRVVQFLLDAESGFITGQTWFVCGGASVGSLNM